MCINSNANRIIHVCPQLNKAVRAYRALGATVWANVQGKVAVVAIFINPYVH